MRRILLATTCAATAALAVAPRPASALFGAGDTVFCLNCEQEWQAALRWAQQLKDMGQQVTTAYGQLQQLQQTYAAFTRITDLNSAVSALGMVGIRNPLPVNPAAVQSLLNGTGGTSGMLGSIGTLFTGTSSANAVYRPSGDAWIDQQLARSGGGIAGAQALALQLYQSAGERLNLLPQLQARLDIASTPADREAIIARLAAEQAYITSLQTQAGALGNYMQAQLASAGQQREERLAQSIDAELQTARARGWLPASSGAGGGVVAGGAGAPVAVASAAPQFGGP